MFLQICSLGEVENYGKSATFATLYCWSWRVGAAQGTAVSIVSRRQLGPVTSLHLINPAGSKTSDGDSGFLLVLWRTREQWFSYCGSRCITVVPSVWSAMHYQMVGGCVIRFGIKRHLLNKNSDVFMAVRCYIYYGGSQHMYVFERVPYGCENVGNHSTGR